MLNCFLLGVTSVVLGGCIWYVLSELTSCASWGACIGMICDCSAHWTQHGSLYEAAAIRPGTVLIIVTNSSDHITSSKRQLSFMTPLLTTVICDWLQRSHVTEPIAAAFCHMIAVTNSSHHSGTQWLRKYSRTESNMIDHTVIMTVQAVPWL